MKPRKKQGYGVDDYEEIQKSRFNAWNICIFSDIMWAFK